MFKQDSFNQYVGFDRTKCEHCRTLRHDTNVLVMQRLSELSSLSCVNLVLSIGCVMYLGTSLVCLLYDFYDNSCYPCAEAAIDDAVFHRLEFGSTFLFSLVTTLALVFSPERRFGRPLLLKMLVLLNVTASFVAALLVFTAGPRLMKGAHELEYANELCTALVDILILLTLSDGPTPQATPAKWRMLLLGVGATSVPALQMLLYNLDAPWAGSRAAHMLEFGFSATSAAVSFWFCTDSLLVADKLKLEIMLAPAELSVVVDARSRRAVHNHNDGITITRGVRPAPLPEGYTTYKPPEIVLGRDGVVYQLASGDAPQAAAGAPMCEPCEGQ